MLPCDLEKTREIAFHALPHGQAQRALELLDGLDGLDAELIGAETLQIRYKVCEYTLQGLETALTEQGFHLDNSILSRIRRALAYFCERVQRENLAANVDDCKSRKIYARVWSQHLHGDRDETPEEWRSYR